MQRVTRIRGLLVVPIGESLTANREVQTARLPVLQSPQDVPVCPSGTGSNGVNQNLVLAGVVVPRADSLIFACLFGWRKETLITPD